MIMAFIYFVETSFCPLLLVLFVPVFDRNTYNIAQDLALSVAVNGLTIDLKEN